MKQGKFDFKEHWGELLMICLFIIGFVFAIAIKSAFFAYLIILFFGLMVGRFLYFRKHRALYYFIFFALLLGFMLGNRYADWKIVVLFFIIGIAVAWWVHEEKWIK